MFIDPTTIQPQDITTGIAFIFGFLSFFAPCVVVLIPAFLSHLAGSSLKDLESGDVQLVRQARKSIFLNTIFFIIGFTFIFMALGASLGFVSQTVRVSQVGIERVGGALIIILGLVSLNLIKIPWLQAEHKLEVKTGKDKTGIAKYVSSVVVGGAFAIGWTPCVGPVLAGILALAGTSGSVSSGATFLLAYSIGLMIPFLLTALFTAAASKFLAKHTKLVAWINRIGGVLLIALGILVFTGNFARVVGLLYFLEM